jgi:serine/threonine-protein kinase
MQNNDQDATIDQQKTMLPGISGASVGYLPGDIVDNDYQLLKLLGHGGMGAVFACRHMVLQKNYALKLLSGDTLTGEAWTRFQAEAIVGIHNMGIDKNQCPYYVMDLLAGDPLDTILKKNGRLNLELALEIFIQVADALSSAHLQGIVHRDVKPSNMMLVEGQASKIPLVKIVDFGIARVPKTGTEAQSQTATGLIFGTPFYMSPEQCEGAKADQRSDIYSFGCAFFEALSGRPPFVGESAFHTFLMHQSDPQPDLPSGPQGQSYPPALSAAIKKMMNKKPADRYQTMDQVKHDLERIRAGKPIMAVDTKSLGAAREWTSASMTQSSADMSKLETIPPAVAKERARLAANSGTEGQQSTKDNLDTRGKQSARGAGREESLGQHPGQKTTGAPQSAHGQESGDKAGYGSGLKSGDKAGYGPGLKSGDKTGDVPGQQSSNKPGYGSGHKGRYGGPLESGQQDDGQESDNKQSHLTALVKAGATIAVVLSISLSAALWWLSSYHGHVPQFADLDLPKVDTASLQPDANKTNRNKAGKAGGEQRTKNGPAASHDRDDAVEANQNVLSELDTDSDKDPGQKSTLEMFMASGADGLPISSDFYPWKDLMALGASKEEVRGFNAIAEITPLSDKRDGISKKLKTLLSDPAFASTKFLKNGVFHFPKDVAIGFISIDKKPSVLARGDIAVPQGKDVFIYLSPGTRSTPELLGKFGPNDLTGLSMLFDKSEKLRNAMVRMSTWGRLKDIWFFDPMIKTITKRTDDWGESEIKDFDLPWLDRFRALRSVGLCYPVSGKAILQRPFIRTIHGLLLKRIINVDPLLAALPELDNINEVLLMSQETTDAQLEPFTRMKNLHKLTILRGYLTLKSLEYFKQMKGLHELRLDRNDWTAVQKEAFQKALPNCSVTYEKVIDKSHWPLFEGDNKK